MKEDKDKAFER